VKRKQVSPSNNNFIVGVFVFITLLGVFIYASHKHQQYQKEIKIKKEVKYVKKTPVLLPKKISRVKKETRPRVAFVIDDWGYNLSNIDLLLEIDRPFTLAILPNLMYSDDIIEMIHGKPKYDAILHLPMESKSGEGQENDTIKRIMAKERILTILERDINSIPGIIGVSNHQGSKLTEDRIVISIILGEIKGKNLFYFDSKTTPVSVCWKIANNIGLRYAERDVFLDLMEQKDPKKKEAAIKKQIRKLIDIAKQKGRAIGIGHDRTITIKVIKESIFEIERQNIEIVPLKDMVR
jgi:polysaccharide deacetylase 2 family uncharacterized protein YibQ